MIINTTSRETSRLPLLWLICMTKFLLPLIANNLQQEYLLICLRHLISWIVTFFSDKLQHYGIQGPEVIPFGAPRGSIFGPLFFIIYINDLGDASRLVSILFADDTNLFISEKDPVTLNNILNSERNKLSAWFAANKLSLQTPTKKDSTMILTFSLMGER